ncbi:Aminotransferase, class IV, partial [mine drainage metagenome]
MVEIAPLKSIWMDGRLVPWPDAQIHVLTHALHYGYAIFEGIRCFATDRGPAIFRLSEHVDRFMNSAKIYRMALPYSREELEQACIDLVRDNGLAEAYV